MLRGMSPVYIALRSCVLPRFSPKTVALTVFVLALCIGPLNLPAQPQQSEPVAGQNHDNAVKQGSESSTETPRSDRQLQIAQQSAGLLQMAKELKAELDATSKETLSVTAFRKANAIERFTQTVKAQKNKHPNGKP
jgi:hypothetical protein